MSLLALAFCAATAKRLADWCIADPTSFMPCEIICNAFRRLGVSAGPHSRALRARRKGEDSGTNDRTWAARDGMSRRNPPGVPSPGSCRRAGDAPLRASRAGAACP